MRILVIEDDESIREIIVELCQQVSNDISEATNGIQGLDLLNKKSFDLVISDYQMPKMSGLDLLQASRLQNIRVPTIWLSGRNNPELKIYAWEQGLFDYLEKPFDVEEFKSSIQMVKSISPELKKEFFEDFNSQSFSIPYDVISKKLKKSTLRGLFDHCLNENVSPVEMVKKIAEES